jgi:hypothetical protein
MKYTLLIATILILQFASIKAAYNESMAIYALGFC